MKNLAKLSVLFGGTALVGSLAQASTDYGPAIYRPMSGCSKWYTSGNGHHFCVIHDMEGYYASTISYLNSCNNTVSIHYMVNGLKDATSDYPAGEITQSVREAYYAWHVGCWNTWMWGTEHEGFASNPAWYTTAMYNSSSALQKHLALQTGHPIDRNHIIGHNEHNNANWRSWMSANYPSINTLCNSHTDPGPYWDWSTFMGLINGINPPYYFDADAQGWFSGNSLSGLTWTACCGWPGIIYADQTGNDAFYYSGTTSYTGGAEASCNVSIYPQSGNTANHDMQIFWKTSADNTWTAGKSSPPVSYTCQNNWARVNLDINQAWPTYYNQNINQLRLDMDNNNSATRWIVNHVIVQGSLRWRFDADPQGWVSGNSLSPIAYSNSGWPGIIYADQTGNDPQFLSTGGWVMYGGINDTVHVRVYPQNGSTANHDMQIFFASGNENFFSEDKSLTTYYTAKDGWADVWFDFGVNGKWNGDYIRQIRLDVDQINQGNRWIIDSCTVEHNTAASYIHAPTVGQQPVSTTVLIGQNATFSVFPNGPAPFTYQWRFNGANIAGATGASYTKANAQLTDAGNYSCVIANSGGNVTSANATLTVNSPFVTAIVDNVDAGFAIVGAWSTGTSSTDKYGADYRFRSTGGTGANTATWTANLANTGNYHVYAWWPQGANRTTVAPYKVNGGATIAKNQQTGGGVWNLLGDFALTAGNNNVSVSDNCPAGLTVMADAVKFVQY